MQNTEVKIRCRYCDLKDICGRRKQKEKYEKEGWMTLCSLTPNRPGKKKKKKKAKKKK